MSLDLRERISGCWAGKCLGGAIGMPFEGVPYRPNLTPESIRLRQDVPNDDLEMQLIWLTGLRERGLDLDAAAFGDLWRPTFRPGATNTASRSAICGTA